MFILYREIKPSTDSNATWYGATDRVDPPLGNYTSSDPSRTSLTEFQLGKSESFRTDWYWSATEYDYKDARNVRFGNGSIGSADKGGGYYVRAVRRVYL